MNRTTIGGGLAAAVVAAGLLASTPVAAVTKTVVASDDKVFLPRTESSAVGGSIRWLANGIDRHSATSDDLVFDSGAARTNLNFTRKFSAGTYPYHCREHGDQGMRGVIRVAPQVQSAPAGLAFTVRWAAAGTNTGNSFDVKYRVGRGPWKTWRNNTSAKSMVFGRGGPVAVARGKSYSFQVRSGTGARESGFSPVKTFRG
jgi:plastocyanin